LAGLNDKRCKKRNKRRENKTKENNTSKKIDEIPEFFYIDEVPKENLNGKHIFIDPGKKKCYQ
jgi:hypothetical protein